jgi:hypothetical protein
MTLSLGHRVIEPFLGADWAVVPVGKLSVLAVAMHMPPFSGCWQSNRFAGLTSGGLLDHRP